MEIVPTRHQEQGQTAGNLIAFKPLDGFDFERFIRANGGKPNTQKTYKSCLKKFFAWLGTQPDCTRPTKDTIDRYRDSLIAEGKKPRTIRLYLVAVEQLFKWLESEGKYPNIAQYVSLKQVSVDKKSPKSYFDIDQIKKILQGIQTDTEEGQRNYCMLALMFSCGLRTIEVSRAIVSDIGLIGSRPVLFVKGKGHADRDAFVPLPAEVHKLLVDYLKARGIKKDLETSQQPLFASTNNRNKGQALSTRSIRRICKTAFISAGFDSPKWTAHSTRHSTGINALKAGQSARNVQMLLRHSSVDTTEIYLHQIGEEENQASAVVASEIFS